MQPSQPLSCFLTERDAVSLTFPGKNTSTVGGKWYLHESGGYSSTVLVSGDLTSTEEGSSDKGSGSLANDARVDGSSPSPGIVSRGRLTTTFFDLGAGALVDGAFVAGAATLGAGSGLTFLWGPPSTALGGPPTLMLADLLLLGTNGGANGARATWGGKPAWPRGVMGMPGGGIMPAAASCMTLG